MRHYFLSPVRLPAPYYHFRKVNPTKLSLHLLSLHFSVCLILASTTEVPGRGKETVFTLYALYYDFCQYRGRFFLERFYSVVFSRAFTFIVTFLLHLGERRDLKDVGNPLMK